MKVSEFHIGLEFVMSAIRWRCTDVGSRTVIAIKLDSSDASWEHGPPYAVLEHVLDEDDLLACRTFAEAEGEEVVGQSGPDRELARLPPPGRKAWRRVLQEHPLVREAVKRAVDASDPEGLLTMGAPNDEYQSEVDDLTLAIDGGELMTTEVVERIWRRWFGDAPAREGSLVELARALARIQSRAPTR